MKKGHYIVKPVWCYYVYQNGKLIYKGSMADVIVELGISEYSIKTYCNKKKPTAQGYIIDRCKFDYDSELWDIANDEDEIIFTGNNSQIRDRFNYKEIDVRNKYLSQKRLQGKYRIFRHGEYIKPQISKDTVWISEMLLIEGNTSIDGKILDRTLRELGKLNIKVDIEPSSIFKNGYVLYRRT